MKISSFLREIRPQNGDRENVFAFSGYKEGYFCINNVYKTCRNCKDKHFKINLVSIGPFLTELHAFDFGGFPDQGHFDFQGQSYIFVISSCI